MKTISTMACIQMPTLTARCHATKYLTKKNALPQLSGDPKGLPWTFISLPSASWRRGAPNSFHGEASSMRRRKIGRNGKPIRLNIQHGASDGIELEQRGAAVCASDISWDPNGWEEQRDGRDGSQDKCDTSIASLFPLRNSSVALSESQSLS